MSDVKTQDPKRRALGRGLEALLPSRQTAPAPTPAPAAQTPSGKPLEVDVTAIVRNPFQTRTRFDEDALNELAQSVAATGVVQPIVVRALPGGKYQLIAGERRWLASQRAGKKTIPVIVREVSDEQAMEMTIVENLQRADLNPMEQARAYDRLGREFKMTQEQMAQRTGKERASVANFLRLLKLPQAVQEKVEGGELSFGHARALLALESEAQMLAAAQKIVALSLSVRGTENYVKGLLDPERKLGKVKADEEPEIDPNVKAAQDKLQRSLGLKVRIEDTRGKGRVVIEYSNLEDFDTLLTMLSAN
ncbi:ParB/RepB/Spo0J family partition protein [Terriglobus roseus]|uniref:Chromosome partitioning protein, ParB family n=1 Tax=Terriglobus roseus TaxID=392734 RepID=A0A1G7PL98_9BACT|nr:ParB/RepB/Spo0J family partition protein [Terriglobus roseus]SDF87007.1 chromosome partitioning protein, ParB family [Terriglobus roseus]